MPIPESQLETWSHQGAITTSASTYADVRAALEAPTAGYAAKDYKIFLQGSYGNDSNIYKESDVDVVIQLNSTFFRDISKLTAPEQALYLATFNTAEYGYEQYKGDVEAALRSIFGKKVKAGNKAIKIEADGNRRSADVIPACQFRRYKNFQSLSNQEYVEGICFFSADNTQINNYPEQHSENCTQKHQSTESMFKPVVRIFKNMRTKLVAAGLLASNVAPSYYIEGLLYNIPDEEFQKPTWAGAVVACLKWLHAADAAARDKFVCANYQYWLLTGPPEVTWPSANCDAFIKAVIKMWNDWES